jgi:alkanesulfonate monooxygenase SsuD/methylene tetrahydromethanopterin reductase-like flavin-dependent oxidoreductase (luciferase family)
MSPLPAQGAALPIIVGGRSDHGVARAGRLGDGSQLSQNGPAGMAARLPVLRAAAKAAGRPVPPTSARAQVSFGPPPADATPAAIHGTPDDSAASSPSGMRWSRRFALDVDETDTDRAVAKMERSREVLARVRHAG